MLNRLFNWLPLPVAIRTDALKLTDIFDGFLLATPKRRTPVRKKWQQKYGCDNWKYGTKLWKPKRNIVTCPECGDFHEIHTICRTCFAKVEEKTNEFLMKEKSEQSQRVWFSPNLAQAKANTSESIETKSPRPIDGS